MKRKEQSVLLAGLLGITMALGGCSSTGTGSSGPATATTSGSAVSQGGGAGATASTSDSGTSASATDTSAAYGSGGSSAVSAAAPNSTVTSIEVVPRSTDSMAGASTAVGGSGTGGSTASATGAERMYRISLRMDDGRTQVVTQEWAPTFSTGDRVHMNSGVIQR